jgi:hypothetical protein
MATKTAPRFVKGQIVKAFCKCGLQRQEQWTKGTVVGLEGKGKVTVKMPDKNHTLPFNKVKRWEPLEDGKLEEFAAKNFVELVEYIKKGVTALCPSLSVEVDEAEQIVYLDSRGVSVQAEVHETESIVAFTEFPTWGVTSWHPTHGTRWEPPDVDEVNRGNSPNNINAAALVIETCWRLRSDNFWQCEGESKMFEQMEADELAAQSALGEN